MVQTRSSYKKARKRKRLKISSTTKKKSKNNDDIAPIYKLPRQMVGEILARLAASSRIDLFRAKLSCRLLNEVANDDYIYRHMSLDRLPPPPTEMKPEVCSFLQRCKQSGNPEAFYREGVMSFLRDPESEYGLDCLKRAASSGHAGASYVLGIDLICNGSESDMQHGVELLGNIKSSRLLRECRNDFKNKLWWVQPYNVWSIKAKFLYCSMIDPQKKMPAWPLLDHHQDQMCCQTCRWNLEIHHVDCILRDDFSFDGPERCERIIE